MRFQVVASFRSRGHDAVHVFDLDMAAARDEQILARAAEEDRVLLTSDLGFGEIRARAAGSSSVWILRLRSQGSARHCPARAGPRWRSCVRLAQALPALEGGVVVTVEEARLRIRRMPVE
jgi:hypothetical protein